MFLLSACVADTTVSIDDFIDNYNQNTQSIIIKEDFTSYVSNDEINYCTLIGNTLLTVTVQRENMKIESINLSCDNSASDNIIKLAENIINCTSESDTKKTKDIIESLNIEAYYKSDNFYKSYVFEKDLTYGFISIDAGNLFYVNFNELNPVSPTEIPEFQENYTLSENRE